MGIGRQPTNLVEPRAGKAAGVEISVAREATVLAEEAKESQATVRAAELGLVTVPVVEQVREIVPVAERVLETGPGAAQVPEIGQAQDRPVVLAEPTKLGTAVLLPGLARRPIAEAASVGAVEALPEPAVTEVATAWAAADTVEAAAVV